LRIVIASILKPLDDVRHYHKLAVSLLKTPNTDIHILGQIVSYSLPKTEKNICFYPVCSSQPSIVKRVLSQWKSIVYFIKVKPEVIIACTNELLIVSILYKILFGVKIVYDIQENYAKNIQCNFRFNFLQKVILSNWVRWNEQLCSPFIDQFWLAEHCYKQELTFVKTNFIVLENKSLFFKKSSAIQLKIKTSIHLLFSGTIAKENGIFEAIELIIGLHNLDHRFHLKVIGCCHQKDTYKRLIEISQKHSSFMYFEVKQSPIPYEYIQEEIFKSDIGLVCYRTQENFKDKLPTKLYEYTSAGLPILLQKNTVWEDYCRKYENAIVLDFNNFNVSEINQLIQNKVFYSNGNEDVKHDSWMEVEKRLLESFNILTNS